MTTDNRTNEQLAERLRQFAESQAMDGDSYEIAKTLEVVAGRLVDARGVAPQLQSDALEFTSEEKELLARYRSKETVESISYKDWKRGNKNYGIPEVLEWAKEARDDVRLGSPWIAHESYRRSVVPANLVPVLEEFLACTADVAKIESLILGRTATAGARAVVEWMKGQGR